MACLSVVFCLACLLAGPGAALAATYYVDANVSGGTGDAGSWENASSDLAGVLDIVGSGDEIWVAEGTYRPTEGTADRTASFALKSGVKLYGGFAAEGSPDFGDRSPGSFATVLTGDLDSNDVVAGDGSVTGNGENSYHVVTAVGVDDTTVLDGFTITGGNANSGSVDGNHGGGMYVKASSPSVKDCVFRGNAARWKGAGMYSEDSVPMVDHCTFKENRAAMAGGGMYNYKSPSIVRGCVFSGNAAGYGGGMANDIYDPDMPPEVTDCVFIGNSATGSMGGGMYNSYSRTAVTNCTFVGNRAPRGAGMTNQSDSNPVVVNCTFYDNVADDFGGGIYNFEKSSPEFVNCTFGGNRAVAGAGMYSKSYASSSLSMPRLSNCILWDADGGEVSNGEYSKPTLEYCLVRSGDVGTGTLISGEIISGDPLLGPLADNGTDIRCGAPGEEMTLQTLSLGVGSPAIDAGLAGGAPSVDQRGESRPQGHGCDMGAFEFDEWYVLTVSGGMGGAVSVSRYGEVSGNCPVMSGDVLSVTATPDDDWGFDCWSGDLAETSNPATLTVDGDKSVEAIFRGTSIFVSSEDVAGDPDAALMEALADVADGGTITFSDDLAGETLTLSDELSISQNVILVAPEGGLNLSGGGLHRVLSVEAGGEVTLEGFTLSGGDVTGEAEKRGGGILNEGNLALRGCTVSANRAESGAGICNDGGNLSLFNCTFSENEGLWGSAVANRSGGSLAISHSTISGNSDMAVFNHPGSSLEMKGVLAAANGTYDIIGGNCLSLGHNLVGIIPDMEAVFGAEGDIVLPGVVSGDLFLGSLGAYGGGTETLALRTGSLALDGCASTDLVGEVVSDDQRGVVRPQGSGCDIGAYEAEWHTVTVSADVRGSVSAAPYGVISGSVGFTAFDTPEFVITPDEGMAVAEVQVDGEARVISPEGGTLTLGPLDAAHTLEVRFAVRSFTVTATAGPGGSVDPEIATVEWGDSHTVSITSEAGYIVVDVMVDGESIEADTSYTFQNVRENHSLVVRFAPDSETGGVESMDITDGGDALVVIIDGSSGLDLPDGVSFDRVGSADVKEPEVASVCSGDIREALTGDVPEGTFLTGSSFDVAAEDTLGLEGTGVLPLDVTLEVPRAKLTPACLEAIERAGTESGLEGAFLGEVEIFKVTEGKSYNLYQVAFDAGQGCDPEDSFAVSRDGAGNFHVGLKLLIADAPSNGVPAVQAVVASGDCRFLVFDGCSDDHFVDPLMAVERPRDSGGSGGGGGGCSVGLALPGMALLLVPLMLLRIRK